MKMNGMDHAEWMTLAEEYEENAKTYRQKARDAVVKEKIVEFLDLAANEQSLADGIRKLEGF